MNPHGYPNDPVGYARDVLGLTLWSELEDILRAMLVYPHRVLVKSGHGTGKTLCAAISTNWFYDSFNPSLVITTAPTKRDVCDLLWKEVRTQRDRAGLKSDFIGPGAPEMRSASDHYAKGYTAGKSVSFQGRHDARMLFIFDEAAGVAPSFWETTKTMWKPELGHIWLAILNPTDTTTQAYLEDNSRARDGKPAWNVFSLSCLDHPNIRAELAGVAPPVPAAVSKSQIDGWVTDWCNPITAEEATVTDIQWPPGGAWFRPGPQFESRCLGRWPSSGNKGVWNDSLWQSCTTLNGKPRIHPMPLNDLPQLGCDVARFGSDNSAICVRWGDTVLYLQSANGWAITQTAGRLVALAREYAGLVTKLRGATRAPCKAEELLIKVDDSGVGGGVVDILSEQGFNVVGVNAGDRAMDSYGYPNKRSELWFMLAERARLGRLALGKLDRESLHGLKSQAMAPEWKQDAAGRRVVEMKDVTKEKIGRSPDEMDCVNLAFHESTLFDPPPVLPPQDRPSVTSEEWREERQPRRKLFGR